MCTVAKTHVSDMTYVFSVRLTRRNPTHDVKDKAVFVIREQYLAPREQYALPLFTALTSRQTWPSNTEVRSSNLAGRLHRDERGRRFLRNAVTSTEWYYEIQ
jgi:hypothetical protein